MKILEQDSDRIVLLCKENDTRTGVTYTFYSNGHYHATSFTAGDPAHSNWQLSAHGKLQFKHTDMRDYEYFNSSTPEELQWMASVVSSWIVESSLL